MFEVKHVYSISIFVCSGRTARYRQNIFCKRPFQTEVYLDGDVKSGNVEGLEHDLCGVLAVLGGVQGRLR